MCLLLNYTSIRVYRQFFDYSYKAISIYNQEKT